MDRKEDSLLLIRKYGLDSKPYNGDWESVTWADSSLRSWLNSEFIQTVFSNAEKDILIETLVTADKNPDYDTDPGKDTKDKVFLLSISEAEIYFKSDEDRMCAATSYAKANDAWTSSSDKTASGEATCYWWLRSPGYRDYYAALIITDGGVIYDGDIVGSDNYCVRPALWINLEP